LDHVYPDVFISMLCISTLDMVEVRSLIQVY